MGKKAKKPKRTPKKRTGKSAPKACSTPDNRDANGRFRKGVSGNLAGRPKVLPKLLSAEKLEDALIAYSKLKGKGALEHIAERFFESDTVMIAILKKFAPDLRMVEGQLEHTGEVTLAMAIHKALSDGGSDKRK